jgi:hypothetical protein
VWDLFKDQAKRVVDSVLDPVVTRLVGLKWPLRMGILVATLAAGILAAAYRTSLSALAENLPELYAVSVAAGDPRIPLRPADSARLDRARLRLITLRQPALSEPLRASQWTTAQTVVALSRLPGMPSDPAFLERFFKIQQIANCACWQEEPTTPPHTAISAWILLALASMGRAAPSEDVAFLILSQKSDGWWAIYPATDDDRNASTYATAMSVLALHEQLKLRHDPGIEQAVKKGASWLMRHRDPGTARWKDYPQRPDNPELFGVSGLVIHALHRINQPGMVEIDHSWLENLPAAWRSAAAWEDSNTEVDTERPYRYFKDSTRYYPVQWVLIGIGDAYSSGTIAEKISAAKWVERALPSIENSDRADEWVVSELLMAVRYVAGERPF